MNNPPQGPPPPKATSSADGLPPKAQPKAKEPPFKAIPPGMLPQPAKAAAPVYDPWASTPGNPWERIDPYAGENIATPATTTPPVTVTPTVSLPPNWATYTSGGL
eukprot:1166836-Heterocapsa_arctica.AAC.1